MSSTDAVPSEAREVALVEKLEMRIALAQDDKKLQAILLTFLPPLLLKLDSPHLAVRNKTISVCQHITLRLESPSVQLPAAALINQLKQDGHTPLFRHFNTKYARLGIARLPDQPSKDQVLQDAILRDISKHLLPPSATGAYLLHFFFCVLKDYKLPKRGDLKGETLREFLKLSAADCDALSFWFGKIFLAPTKNIAPTNAPTAVEQSVDEPGHQSTIGNSVNRIPGLSKEDLDLIRLSEFPDAWKSDSALGLNFGKTKTLICEFAETDAFEDKDRLWPFLCAISDTNPAGVADRGKLYTKLASGIDMEDSTLVKRLYTTYLGVDDGPEKTTPPAPLTLRTRILTLLARSDYSANLYPELLDAVLLEGLVDSSAGLAAERFNISFINFVIHVFRLSDRASVGSMGSSLALKMKDFLNDVQGWPKPDPGIDLQLRGKVYRLIGLACNEGRVTDLGLLEFLLQSLSEDTSGKETLLYVEEALSSMTLALSRSPLNENEQFGLEDILLRFLKSAQQHKSLIFVLARLANRCLPFSNVVARSIDINAMGGPHKTFEGAEEGRKGLDPLWFKTTNLHRPDLWSNSDNDSMKLDEVELLEYSFPRFLPLMREFFPGLKESSSSVQLKYEVQERARKVPSSFAMMIKFAFRILVAQSTGAQKVATLTENWDREMDMLLTKNASKRKLLYSSLLHADNADPLFTGLDTLMLGSLQAFSMHSSSDVLDCQDIFVQLLSVSPKPYRKRLVQYLDFDSILTALKSSDRTTRELAARAFGILFSERWSSKESESNIKTLSGLIQDAKNWQSSSGIEIQAACGAIMALTQAFVRLTATELSDSVSAMLQDLNRIACQVASSAKNKDLIEASLSTIGQFGIWLTYGHKLSFPVPGVLDADKELTKDDLVSKLAKQAEEGNERAAVALGRFSVWLEEESDKNLLMKIYKSLYECHSIRQSETHFAVGEAMSCVAFGSDNTTIETEFDATVDPPKGPSRTSMATYVLLETLKGCKASKPALRRGSIIWLLSLVQYGSHHEVIQSHLTQCQRAFMLCLSDREELVQEAAARGLGLVYEKGDKKLKDALVADLVSSFSDNKAKMSGTVELDTELFSEGVLRTHDGSVSTYKDILDLASEVGNPSLVYQFMSLAADSAIWNSRAAFGKFGLSNIFSDSGADGYLAQNPKLYPALYRYQFDSNPGVQRSMRSLWQSLVKNPQETLNDQFDVIMRDLLKHVLGREWRAREASCRAIADLIQDRKFERYEKYMDEIWTCCSKVMDDIKGSVREAAKGLSRTLTAILVRNLETGEPSKALLGMLGHTIPFLLDPARIDSAAEDVKAWSVSTLLTIIKKSKGSVLEEWIPLLLESFITLFSSLEPAAVNYLHLNAAKYNTTASEIDGMRLQATRQSPLMEALETLLDMPYKNPDTPNKIIIVVEQSMQRMIGMPSLTATSRIIVTMFVRHHARYKEFADRLLTGIRKPLTDRNDTVSSSFAYTVGYIARWASDQEIKKIADYGVKLWRTSEADRHREVGAEIFQAISKQASEKFAGLSGYLLPFVFVGKHDDQESVKEIFSKTWSDSTSGSRVIMLHLTAMVELASTMLDDPKWAMKHAGARAIAEATDVIAGLDALVAPEEAPKVWPALAKALGGKTWEGKEVVLQAFGKFVEKVAPFWQKDPAVASEMTKIMLREARRQNRDYQRHSFPVLGQFAGARTDLDLGEQVLEIVSPLVDDLVSAEDSMDVDGEDKVKDIVRDDLLAGAITSSAKSFKSTVIKDNDFAPRFMSFLDMAVKANSVQSRHVSISLFEVLEPLLSSIDTSRADLLKSKESQIASRLKVLLFKPQYASYGADTKLKRAKAIHAVAKIPSKSLGKAVLEESLGSEAKSEPTDAVREELFKAVKAIE
ncbi:ARM repeat-containing protein [Microthyrium microscopicum]|uniref:ARM repeat-containing protein n=1 Tax=Microthyrium microscopicum TaxID=703497 RepID=A0A6A6UH14_9PEZI|nr:ARM repeat-containing protein [Microthyrium microscopicum]